MKIIYLVHQFFPEFRTGTENFILNNALMTQRFVNKVKVITYSFYENNLYDNETNGILFKEFFYEDVPIIACRHQQIPPNMNLVLHNHQLYVLAQALLRAEKPDVIHVGHPMRVHEIIWAAVDLAIPYVITLTDFFFLCPKINLMPGPTRLCSGPKNGEVCAVLCPEYNPDFIKDRLAKSKELLVKAKTITSPSKFVANMFLKEFPELEIQIVPHGINYAHIKSNDHFYKQGNSITFGYLGNLIYHKGIHILISAFNKLSSSNIQLKIFGFGQDSFVQQLEDMASDDKRITFEGTFKSENLGEVFSQIDILVIPTLVYETYSFVLHEAFACNVPVIGSNLGVMREKIHDDYNGYKFEPGDAFNLKNKMELLIDNPQVINELKSNIKKDLIVPRIEQEAYIYREIYRKNI